MEHEREFVRYKIGDPKILRGSLEHVSWPLQLVTFGNGGCGFFCLVKIPALVPPKRVHCSFALDRTGHAGLVRVQGNLIYVKEIVTDNRSVNLYGIEFIEPHRLVVKPIVSVLEQLKDQGVIHSA
jgi:hypothetical protein